MLDIFGKIPLNSSSCTAKFPSVKVNEVKGGCNPAPLKREVEGDQLIIKIEDIMEGDKYFNFTGGGK